MLVPLSWLKEYVPIKIGLEELMWRMTEVGMTTESYRKVGDDIVLDVEVTANRPDWMSIIGIAREVAVIQKQTIKPIQTPEIPQPVTSLPLDITNNFKLSPRYTAVIVENVELKASPDWMQQRLTSIGLRSINNLVDVTNYVMFESGSPIHVFDYDKIHNGKMVLTTTRGTERFTSVDNKEYTLPKNSIVFKNGKDVIDLCGIKGGLNSGVTPSTKNILLLVAVYNGVYIRKTSQALGLWSDASRIFERGADSGATLNTLKRAVDLTLNLAGGKVASKVTDVSLENFSPWKLCVKLSHLENILGIAIPKKQILEILGNLNLQPKLNDDEITCIIPTYRGDLKIEEDLIEEVARFYGYNNFPRTLPVGNVVKEPVPYSYDREWELKIKRIMFAAGYSEVKTLALQSANLIRQSGLKVQDHIRIANPVSSEYEFLRNNIITGLLTAIKINAEQNHLKLFEYDKVYFGPLGDTKEPYLMGAVETNADYRSLKGSLDDLLHRLNFYGVHIEPGKHNIETWHPKHSGILVSSKHNVGIIGEINPQVLQNFAIKDKVYGFEIHTQFIKEESKNIVFSPLPKFPAQIEDLTLVIPHGISTSIVQEKILNSSEMVKEADLIDVYNNSYTFRIRYQNPAKTLLDEEVGKIRRDILEVLKKEYGISQS